MNFWNLLSWILVALFSGINLYIFLKLKEASEQMLKMVFPNAKNMNEALDSMQKMTQSFKGPGGASAVSKKTNGFKPALLAQASPKSSSGAAVPQVNGQQLQQAMKLLKQLQNNKKP